MKTTAWVITSIVVLVLLVGGGILLFGGSSTGMTVSGSQMNIPSVSTNNQPATQATDTSGQNSQQNTAPSGKTYSINIQNFAFSPKTLTIQKGDTVVWTNMDSAPHTVTSDAGNLLASPTLSTGQTYSQTFNDAGTFTYHCSVHPMMTGTIIVGDGSTNTGSTTTTTTTSSGSNNVRSSGSSGY